MQKFDEVTVPVYLVYGSRGERLAIGEVVMHKREDKFTGVIEFAMTPSNEAAMDSLRSVTNQA